MKISDKNTEKFKAHALSAYPQEVCGLLVNGEYVPCKNIFDKPEKGFKIASKELLKYKDKIEVIFHSHPYVDSSIYQNGNKPEWPSYRDMEMWIAFNMKIPWVIYATDGKNISNPILLEDTIEHPLLDRPFIFGIYDCYSVARDWMWQNKKILLKNYPRQWGWWHDNKNLINDQFMTSGWKEIQQEEANIGDGVLMQVSTPVPSHVAIISNTNEIIHHLPYRGSERDYLNRWDKQIVKWLRYESKEKKC